jgi:hypothetical protein
LRTVNVSEAIRVRIPQASYRGLNRRLKPFGSQQILRSWLLLVH